MKIEYLRETIILAEYLNYTMAAEHLFITQPVLSRHINALETELGVKIFRRSTHNVRLTEAGTFFLERIQSILAEYDGLLRDVSHKDPGYDTELRIGIPYYKLNYYLGQVPRLFMAAYPRIKLSFLTDYPDHIIEALKTDKVDLLITARMPFKYSEDFTFYDVFLEPYNVLFPRKHPLAERAYVTIGDLFEETFLGVKSNYFECTWSLIRKLCRLSGFQPNAPVQFNQIESAHIAVGQGLGIIVEGQDLINVSPDEVVPVPLVGEDYTRPVSIVYKNENNNQAIHRFIRIYEDSILQGRSQGSTNVKIPIIEPTHAIQ